MLNDFEIKMLKSRMIFDNFHHLKIIRETFGCITIQFKSSIFSIEKDLFDRLQNYMEKKMILLTADNHYSLGIVKLILINNNIDYSHHSDGYLLKRKDFLEKKSLFDSIKNIEIMENV